MTKLIGCLGKGGSEMAGSATPTARRRRLALGAAAALALLVVVGRLQQGELAPHRPGPTPAQPTTTTRPLPVTATIPLGVAAAPPFADQAAQLMVGEGRLWAVLEETLVGVDPRRTSAVARIRLGRPGEFVNLLAVGAGAVWVGTEAGVVRVDPATNQVTATLPDDHPPEAAGADSLWSLDCISETKPCDLLHLDPRSLHAAARFRLPGVPAGPPAVDDDTVWLLDPLGRWVWRVDPPSARVTRVRLPSVDFGAVPGQLAIGEGAVWVLTTVERPTPLGSRVDTGLVRIDPHTNRISATTPLADLGSDPSQARLAVGAGGVWVEGQQLSQDGAVIFRVDPASGRLLSAIATGDLSPAALAVGFGALWLLRPGAGVLLGLDPAGIRA
jgi:hypothetical protein